MSDTQGPYGVSTEVRLSIGRFERGLPKPLVLHGTVLFLQKCVKGNVLARAFARTSLEKPVDIDVR